MAACKLAGELLEAGEAPAVLEFLELSKRKVRRDLRERWIEQVGRGEVPDFGIDPSGSWPDL
ncbi:MAG: hypothetical protein AB7W16_15070 [Candidatus Obscuribacterales bacterium]